MNKLRWLVLPFALAVLLIGGVLLTMGAACTAGAEAAAPQVLTMDIPDRTLALNGAETLDMWMYTTYSGDQANLIYTATTEASALFAADVTGTHYLNIASTSATTGGEFRVDITAGDGLSTTTDAFTVTVTSVPTLSISIPWEPYGLGVPYNGQRMWNLWDYTTYYLGDKSGLVYTVTQLNGGENMTVELVDGHTMSVTAVPYRYPYKYADVDIEVSDGDLYYLFGLVMVIDYDPTLRFYGAYYKVAPNPVKVLPGQTTYLTHEGSDEPQPLGTFLRNMDVYTAHYRLVGDVPPQLGAVIITNTVNCFSYETYCHHLTFSPPQGAWGTYRVEVEASNDTYITSSDVLTVTIMQQIFLPAVIRGYPPGVTLHPIDNPDGDGVYDVEWSVTGGGYDGFDLEYATNPQFTDATRVGSYSFSYSAETLTPGTYYWRARAYKGSENFSWSNVVTVNVGSFAYLYVEPLCAYGLRVELFGPINASIEYESGWCGDVDYWRSVPAGTYTTRLTWIGGSIVENVPSTALGVDEYIIVADEWPNSAWKPY